MFEDRANGYAIGDYKKRPNMIGMYQTARPESVPEEMDKMLNWYLKQEVSIPVLAEFHVRYVLFGNVQIFHVISDNEYWERPISSFGQTMRAGAAKSWKRMGILREGKEDDR